MKPPALTTPIGRLLFTAVGLMAGAGGPASAAVVVEEAARHFAGDQAGLAPGDVIVSWSRAPAPPAHPLAAAGTIASPFALAAAAIEQPPRGVVTLEGRRAGRRKRWRLPPSQWRITVRPVLPPAVLARHVEARRLAAAGRLDDALGLWRAAAEATRGLTAVWLQVAAARACARGKRSREADAAYEAAAAAADRLRAPAAAAEILRERGEALEQRNEWDAAAAAYTAARERDAAVRRDGLAVALDHEKLGLVVARRGRLAEAEPHLRADLAIREQLAPDSLALSAALSSLAAVVYRRGQLDAAEALLRRALQIVDRLAPDGAEASMTCGSMANLLDRRGDGATAEAYYRRALAIEEKLMPGGLRAAGMMINIGAQLESRGDLDGAEAYYRKALAIQEPIAPESLDVALTYRNLGVVFADRGDFEAAEAHYRRALAIRERLTPGSIAVGTTLHSLGNVALERGELAEARSLFERAVEVMKREAPDAPELVMMYTGLADVALEDGRLDDADALARQALAAAQRQTPDGLFAATAFERMGDVLRRRGRMAEARAQYARSLEIRARLAPDTDTEALSLRAIALTYPGQPEATEYFCKAADVVDVHRGAVGGSHSARAGFGATLATFYQECLEALVDSGRAAEAFHVLERSRARSLLALLAERELATAELPAEIAGERRRLDADYDRVQGELRALAAGDAAEIQRLRARLAELREQREALVRRIREASPRFASLQYPRPLDLAGVRSTLDEGSLLLAYAVGEARTVLFAVSPSAPEAEALRVFTLPLGRAALREKVDAFRSDIQRHRPGDLPALADRAAELYDLLVRPAEALAGSHRRLLFSPDGPLHTLPFAALVRRDAGGRAEQALVEWKPLHFATSATLYAEMRRGRGAGGAGTVVAFADPKYSAFGGAGAAAAAPALRAAAERGLQLPPLPAAREEVGAIAALYPQTVAYIGEEAREERVKALRPGVRYLHFACHALINEQRPLDSGLVLTIPERPTPGEDNGLLQAWEIFDSLRLDAELVTLSACETALGKEAGGEGLLGLTQAFQYAGARSVLASLWSVGDDSTAELMRRFYGSLQAGKTKDEALREAQLALLHEGAAAGRSHPFHWAAFQIAGDWR